MCAALRLSTRPPSPPAHSRFAPAPPHRLRPTEKKHTSRDGDEVHLAHVIPRVNTVALHGAPPVDFLPEQDPVAYEQLIKNAEAFIAARFLPRLAPVRPDPVIHIIKSEVDADSVGNVVCAKAGSLGAAALVMASHSKSKLSELFLGSVSNYCTHHCPVPVLIVK